MINILNLKTIKSKFYISPFFLLEGLLFIITGQFEAFIIFTFLITIHEIGHFLTGYCLKWKIDKIALYPYGGVSSFKDDINKPLKEEIIILIMGPFFQIIGYFFLKNILNNNSLILLENYHYALLFFNLLPIYPLDGGKLLNLFLSFITSYKKSYVLSLFISGLTILLLPFLFPKSFISLQMFLILIFLFCKLYEAYKKRKYLYQRFLLERYLKNYNFLKVKHIKHLDKMMRDKIHLVKDGDKYIWEKKALKQYFKRF